MTSEEHQTPWPARATPLPLSQNDVALRKGFSFVLLLLLLLSIAFPFNPLTWATPHGGHGAHLADVFCGDLLLACACYFLSERKGFWPEARTVRKKSLETTRTIDL